MADLYPTKTRLALLRDVDAGNVLDGITDDHVWLVDNPEPPRKVCARMREMEAAGWVEQGEPFWRLTDAGREVLGG